MKHIDSTIFTGVPLKFVVVPILDNTENVLSTIVVGGKYLVDMHTHQPKKV